MAKPEPIEVRIGGKAIADAIARSDRAALLQVSRALIIASRIARYSRDRVKRGEYATKPRPYGTRGRYYISEGYADLLYEKKRRWKSSKAFHDAVAGEPGYVTGGMLKGLRARNWGSQGAVVEFAGKSMGSRIKKRKRGGPNQAVMVANKKKALAVWWRLRVNPIQPKDDEVEAVGSVTAKILNEAIGRTWDAKTMKLTNPSGPWLLINQIARDIESGTLARL